MAAGAGPAAGAGRGASTTAPRGDSSTTGPAPTAVPGAPQARGAGTGPVPAGAAGSAGTAPAPGGPAQTGPQAYAPAPQGRGGRAPVWEAEEDDGWDLLPVGDQAWDEQDWDAAQTWDDGRQPWDDEPWDTAAAPAAGGDGDPRAPVLPAGAARAGGRRPAGAGTGVAVVLVMGAVVVGTAVFALDRFQNAQDAAAPAPEVTVTVPPPSAEPSAPAASAPPSEVAAPTLVSPAGVQALDPQGDGEENDQDAPRAIDGDPASVWTTQSYRTQAFGGLKTGLGLAFDLGAPAEVQSVTVTAPGTGGTYEVRAANGPGFDGSTVVATGQTGDAPSVLEPEAPVTTQFVIVWFTALPQLDGDFRGAVSEVQVQVP